MTDFEEGERYDLDDLPDSEMTSSGNLEMVGDGVLAARYGENYVEFEFASVECTDVTNVNDL